MFLCHSRQAISYGSDPCSNLSTLTLITDLVARRGRACRNLVKIKDVGTCLMQTDIKRTLHLYLEIFALVIERMR